MWTRRESVKLPIGEHSFVLIHWAVNFVRRLTSVNYLIVINKKQYWRIIEKFIRLVGAKGDFGKIKSKKFWALNFSIICRNFEEALREFSGKFAGILMKICGTFEENLQEFWRKIAIILRKICRNFEENLQKFWGKFARILREFCENLQKFEKVIAKLQKF